MLKPRWMAVLVLAASLVLCALPADAGGPYQFYVIAPCRLVDTRNPPGPFGSPSLASGATRSFQVAGQCGIPPDTQAAVLNLTVVNFTQAGFVVVWPYNTSAPITSNINFAPGQGPVANGCVVGLTPGNPNISVTYGTQFAGTTDVIIDITGYYR